MEIVPLTKLGNTRKDRYEEKDKSSFGHAECEVFVADQMTVSSWLLYTSGFQQRGPEWISDSRVISQGRCELIRMACNLPCK